MIVEQRSYTLKVAKLPEFLAAYEAEGLSIHSRHLGGLMGYYVTDVGPLNMVVHLWGYRDYADREARRQRLNADPAWHAFGARVAPLFDAQESRILVPAPFFAGPAQDLLQTAQARVWPIERSAAP